MKQSDISIRKKARLKAIGGSIAIALLIAWLMQQQGLGEQRGGMLYGIFYLIAIGTPGAYALVGILELITGTPFTQLSARWDSLKWWQRGVLGTVVIMIALLITFIVLPVLSGYF
jgi:hypothetical protein